MSMLLPKYYQPEQLHKQATRDGFGQGLLELGKKDARVVVLTADLSESTRVHLFEKAFPERFFQVGVAEQNLMGVAAGMALYGKVPFAASYAVFSPGRNWDQLRVSVCYSQANVKIIGGHAGLSVGPDGATHQALEDIAITRCLPNLTVICPADAEEARKATLAIAQHKGPVYLRTSRESTPVFTQASAPFELGKAQVLRTGTDVTIAACGLMVYEALLAAHHLEDEDISVEVLNVATIKPLDSETILASLHKTKALVTAEEHQLHGGFGSAVSELVVQNLPVPTEMIGVRDSFGESGTMQELFQKYHLTHQDIIKAVKKVMNRK